MEVNKTALVLVNEALAEVARNYAPGTLDGLSEQALAKKLSLENRIDELMTQDKKAALVLVLQEYKAFWRNLVLRPE